TPLRFFVELLEHGFAFGDRGVVILSLAKLDERHAVFEPALQITIGIDRALELLALAHDLLRGFGVVPEARVFRLLVQLGETLLGRIPVKDASAEVLGPPWWTRRAFAVRHASLPPGRTISGCAE